MTRALTLHATATPDRWPADAACDIALRIALRNNGNAPVAVVPKVAKLGAITSYAGIGVVWKLDFIDAAGVAAPITELRTWYGPPGNPPSPTWASSQAETISPGGEHVTEFPACWLPNAVLEPRHLLPETLDPEGMDNIAPSEFSERVPALATRFPLARASVLVVGAPSAQLDRSKDDFLRGHVVALFAQPGAFELRAEYWQDIGTRVHLTAAPVAIRLL
jgi:hypothetical protein